MGTLSELERARLRWRARRGLLENDLILTAFLDRFEHRLTASDVVALTVLFEMGDNDLLDVLLARRELFGHFDTPEVQRLVGWMRENHRVNRKP